MEPKKKFSDWLVVSDIDGTLNNKARRLPERNKKAIEKFVAEGGYFTLASGRNPQSMERHFKGLPISGTPAVVINGAGIYDFQKQEMIHFSAMSGEAMEIAIKAAKKFWMVDVVVVAKDIIYITGLGAFGKWFVVVDDLKHKHIYDIAKVPKEDWEIGRASCRERV